ncbi:MAG: hypothetical protein ACLS9N_12990 [[Clostridium] leptum]
MSVLSRGPVRDQQLEVARVIDSERFAGSLAQVEMNTGYKVTNAALARVRKVAASD